MLESLSAFPDAMAQVFDSNYNGYSTDELFFVSLISDDRPKAFDELPLDSSTMNG